MIDARAIAERLIGTCDIDPEEMPFFTTQQCAEFDQTAFRCEECGWWFEGGSQADDDSGWFCADCRPA